jgi:23S rRNA (adenine2030-N6)-methyltransferase
MNYRHAFHAGNFADVLKHATLVLCLEHLKRKSAAFRVVDTHAGIGTYRLDTRETAATGEWRDGIARLWAATDGGTRSGGPFASLAPYLAEIVRANGAAADMRAYPGSPTLIAALLRASDTFVANELHPDDNERLTAAFAKDKRVKVMAMDGYIAVKSLLPPPEKRGLVLIDPPFEQPGEFQRMTEALDNGLARFKGGTYLLWYPIKDVKPVQRFQRAISDVAGHAGVETVLAIDLFVRAPRHPDLLNGCGLLVVNPPHTLASDLAKIGPPLADLLEQGPGATFEMHKLDLPRPAN